MTLRRPLPARPRKSVRAHSPANARKNTAQPKNLAATAAASPSSTAKTTANVAENTAAGTRNYAHTTLRIGRQAGIVIPARVLALALVVLGAFVFTFPALRGYLSQQAQYDTIVTALAQAQATSTALEAQLAQWDDDDYVKSQARGRLSYVMPGETTYVVVGADEFAQQSEQNSAAGASDSTQPWYEVLQESVQVAGAETADTDAPEKAQQGWATATPAEPSATSTQP